MRSAFFYTLVVSVASVFSQQPFVRYSGNLRKAVPAHYQHDQKNTDRRMDKVARGHKVEPRQPPLRPQPAVPWLRWVHEGRWAAQADKNTELHKVRARLLEEKLKPNQLVFKPRINPQLKPKLNQKENARIKRDVGKPEVESVQKETDIKENVRFKRDTAPQLIPEMIMQPHIEAKMPRPNDQFGDKVEASEKRDKRQIIYFINRPPQLLIRSPRTTPNPFIRDTHIEDYDIIRPEVGEREGMIPSVESGSSDPSSYPLVTCKKVLSDLTKILLNLGSLITGNRQDEKFKLASLKEIIPREKRSPKMSKLKKKQKIEKKKRKKKKQKELSPRQLKHIRRKKEKKERRKRLREKKLKEKRRLRHKKLGTGPYNKTIIDYYGIYYDPPSSQLNESLYDSIYDTSEIDSDALYEERMKERYDDYSESTSEDSDAWYDEQIYGDTKESNDEEDRGVEETESPMGAKEKTKPGTDGIDVNNKVPNKLHETTKYPTSPPLLKNNNTEKRSAGGKKKE